jgi:hypothetical protein
MRLAELASLPGVGRPTVDVEPVDARLLDLASLLHHFVGAEDMAKDVVVREAAQAVATGKHLSDGKTACPAAKIVVPNTGHRSDCQLYLGIADLTFQKVAF